VFFYPYFAYYVWKVRLLIIMIMSVALELTDLSTLKSEYNNTSFYFFGATNELGDNIMCAFSICCWISRMRWHVFNWKLDFWWNSFQ